MSKSDGGCAMLNGGTSHAYSVFTLDFIAYVLNHRHVRLGGSDDSYE